MQLARSRDRRRSGAVTEERELAEVVAQLERPCSRLADDIRLAAEDDEEGVRRGARQDDGLARCILGEVRLLRDLAQLALSDLAQRVGRRRALLPSRDRSQSQIRSCRCITTVQHQRIPVRILEESHVADAGVDSLAVENDALRFQLGARRRDVRNSQRHPCGTW